MDSPVVRRRAVYAKMKVAVERPETRKAHRRLPKRACDSTGWPEGAKATHVERVCHFFCFKFSNFPLPFDSVSVFLRVSLNEHTTDIR